MKKTPATSAVLAATLMAACSPSSVAFNATCKEYCFTMPVSENVSQGDIDAAMKQKCEAMGRHGTPQILQRSKDEIGGTCPA